MSLLSEYRSSLKAVDVEEPIDLVLHRPLAFGVAKLSLPTPLTPNHLTGISIVLGVTGGILLMVGELWSQLAGAALLFLSQVVDCSDGMLARMRKSSSDLGRMLDGVADMFVLLTGSLGSIVVMARLYPSPWYVPVAITVLSIATMHTSSFHTTAYDHYKNVYLRMIVPGTRDEEDLEGALLRKQKADAEGPGLITRIAFFTYVGYLKNQRKFFEWFDPAMTTRAGVLPAYDPMRAEIYKKHALPLMRVWRAVFGVGSMVFGLALFNAFGRPDLYLGFRLLVLNGIFFFYLWPAQRRATRLAFQEMGLSADGHPAEAKAA